MMFNKTVKEFKKCIIQHRRSMTVFLILTKQKQHATLNYFYYLIKIKSILFLSIPCMNIYFIFPSFDCPCFSNILLNNYINKMQINFSSFEEHLSRKDKKDLYCRPLTALVATHTRTNTTDQVFNLSFLTRRKETQGYTTRLQANDKKAYRNIRSASLYQTLYPCVPQDKTCKLQIINNACLKKVFFSRPNPIRKKSSIFDVNATLTQHMQTDITKKENQLPKYHCKKLKVIKGKPRMNGRILSEANNQEDLWGKDGIASVIGTKLL